MSLKVPETSNEQFTILPASSFPARCVRIIDIGTQVTEYNGDTKLLHKIILCFELPTEKFKDKSGNELPIILSKQVTLSMGDMANLRKDIASWRGKQLSDEEAKNFDITKLLGKPCALAVIHKESKGKTYANIGSLTPLMKGAECPPQITDSFFYEIEEGQSEHYNILPDWIKKQIDNCQENLHKHDDLQDANNQISTTEFDNIQDTDLPF